MTVIPAQQRMRQLIEEGVAGDPLLEQYAGPGSKLGRGGMLTKLQAAGKAARSGAHRPSYCQAAMPDA